MLHANKGYFIISSKLLPNSYFQVKQEKMELREFLNNISQEGNLWMVHHIMMEEFRKCEKKYVYNSKF